MKKADSIRTGLVISDEDTMRRRDFELLRRFTPRLSATSVADGARILAFQTIDLVFLDVGARTNEFLGICELGK